MSFCCKYVESHTHLTPSHVQFCSVGISTGNGTIIAQSSRLSAGPCSLQVHTEGTSCLGMVSRKGVAFQGSLAGPGGAIFNQLIDIQKLLETSPECTHLICAPVTPIPGSLGVKGALLLGFTAPPNLSPRHMAGIAALGSMLSYTLSRTAPPVICRVETMLGTHAGGCEVCLIDSDEEFELEEEPSPCRPDSHSDDGSNKDPPPRQSLPLMLSIPEEDEKHSHTHHQHPLQHHDDTTEANCSGSSATFETPFEKPEKMKTTVAQEAPCSPSHDSKFSKQLVASLQQHMLANRHPLLLSYSDAAVEREFCRWFQYRLLPVDVLFTTMIIASMLLDNFFAAVLHVPLHASTTTSGQSLLPMVAMSLPLLFSLTALQRRQNILRREMIVTVARLCLVVLSIAFTAAAAASTSTSSSTSSKSSRACWQVLLAPALGLQLRLLWHLPVQLLALVLMLVGSIVMNRHLVVSGGAVGVAALAVVLPTVALRNAEQHARRTFEYQLSTVAGLERQ